MTVIADNLINFPKSMNAAMVLGTESPKAMAHNMQWFQSQLFNYYIFQIGSSLVSNGLQREYAL